jgi:hypothetical protein
MANPIKIDKGIPIPLPYRDKDGIVRALIAMDVGDSFIWEGPHEDVYRAARQSSTLITSRKTTQGRRFWKVGKL